MPPLKQIRDYPRWTHSGRGPKIRSVVHILSIESCQGSDVFYTVNLTDYTRNKQSGKDNRFDPSYNYSNLRILPENILSCSVHRDKLSIISGLYTVHTATEIDLAEMVNTNSGFVDVSSLMILITMTFELRLYNKFLNPYTWDPIVIDFENVPDEESLLLNSLLRNVFKQRNFINDFQENINKVIPTSWQDQIKSDLNEEFSDSDENELELIMNEISGVQESNSHNNEHSQDLVMSSNTELEVEVTPFKQLEYIDGKIYKIYCEIIYIPTDIDKLLTSDLRMIVLERSNDENENSTIEVRIPNCDLKHFFQVTSIEAMISKIENLESIFEQVKGIQFEMEIVRETKNNISYWKSLMRLIHD